MSDVYSMPHERGKSAFDVIVNDDVGGGSNGVERAIKLLAGIGDGHGAEKAIGSAIKRAAQSGETYAARAIGKFYYLKVSDFKKYTKSKRHIHTSSGVTTVDIDFRGYHVPLLKFNTKVTRNGGIRTSVKKGSTSETLNHVFMQTVGSHTGLFQRVTEKRYPIEEKFGPATTQMMDANDDVSQAIGDKIRETFDSRIEHEILAIMNGWRNEQGSGKK